MSTYLLIDFLIVIFPLLAMFDERISYYKKLPAVLGSILLVGLPYVVWDALATMRGDWAFAHEHVLRLSFFGLPIEEILFFAVVPFSCLFIFESFAYFTRKKRVWFHPAPYFLFSLLMGGLGLFFSSQPYTLTVGVVTALTIIVALFGSRIFSLNHYWQYIITCFGLFIVFNYFLTSIPIVTYGSQAIWGVRVLTIPVEDFLYNFSLLTANLLVYVKLKTFLNIE